MIHITTIILFFTYIWGLGFTATYFLKKPENFLEKNALRMGIGLGVFPILSLLLNLLHIPLDWKTFLFLSVSFPICILIKEIANKKKEIFKFPTLKLTKSTFIILIVIAITAVSLYVYTTGAFNYPYLENEDSWGHAVGGSYVAIEKTAYIPIHINPKELTIMPFMDPYPPAYGILMGILHQTSPDLRWTLKFFNALIISLGFLFFYLFAKELMRNRNKALFATFFLAAIPCYLTHFIWAHSYVITLVFPTLYAFWMINKNKNWTFVAAILMGSVWVTQNLSQPFKITSMLLIYAIVISLIYKKFLKNHFIAIFSGIAFSFTWWGPMIQKYTFKGFVSFWATNLVSREGTAGALTTSSVSLFSKFLSIVKSVTHPGGSGSRAYSFEDFFFAKGQNLINNPVGVGIVLSLLALLGFIFVLFKYRSSIVEKKNTWLCVTLFWFIFTFWAVNGSTFPISIARVSFRSWMLMAIPLSLIAVEGLYFLKSLSRSKLFKSAIVIAVVVGVLMTSAQQKYEVNTAIWPTSGAFQGNLQEAFAYGSWFDTLPPNTKVFLLYPKDKLVIGYGKFSCAWCKDVLDFRIDILNKDLTTIHKFLKSHEYEYILINPIMDYSALKNPGKFGFGENRTLEELPQLYNEIQSSPLFVPVYGQETFGVFRIV